MTAKFSPLWEEASKVLARVAETNEAVVADLAFGWLTGQGTGDDTPQPADEAQPMALTAFECSNLKMFEQAAEKCVVDDFSAKAELQAMFSAVCSPIARVTVLADLPARPRPSQVFRFRWPELRPLTYSAKYPRSPRGEAGSWFQCSSSGVEWQQRK